MLLAFVDESNSGDFHGFAALIADAHATKFLTSELNRIVRQIAVDWGVPETIEIHAHPLFHGRGQWKVVPPRARVGVFHKVVQATMMKDVRVILRSVDAGRLRERQAHKNYPAQFPPEQVGFQHILQRVNSVAQAKTTHA